MTNQIVLGGKVYGGNVDSVNSKTGTVTLTASDVSAIPTSDKGAANGVATLDASGKIPSSQIPGGLDEILEYDWLNAAQRATNSFGVSTTSTNYFPTTGTLGVLYYSKGANLLYRWSGSAYIELGAANGTLPIASGGTGATDAATARANLAVVGGGTAVKDIAVVTSLPSNPVATTLYFVG